MMKKISILAVLCMAFILSCASAQGPVLTGTAEDESLTVKKGKTFSIHLKAQLSTGFGWKLTEGPENLRLKAEKVRTEEDMKAGGVDIQEFIFSGEKTGEYTLVFKYGEHWKKKPGYIKTYTARIKVE